jgi:Domain of unknown function (DUF4157)
MSQHDLAERQVLRFVATQRRLPGGASRAAGDKTAGGVACRLGDASCASVHASTIGRSSRTSVHRSLLRLQRDFGNRYVGQVLRKTSGFDSDNPTMDAIERSIDQARGGGQGMDHGTRAGMESAFGADFSGVRIHTDTRADTLNGALSARAFTTGRDVFFRQGEYSPGTTVGRELLAHELTHVAQQNGDGISRRMTVSEPGDAHEVEADQTVRAIIQQEHAPAAQPIVARREDEEQSIATKRSDAVLQRQPEAMNPHDEEEKKKLHMKRDPAMLSRQVELPEQ